MVYFLFPEKYTLEASIPSIPNFSKIAGIRIIRAYIPLFVGPKTRAIIIEAHNPKTNINTLDIKVIVLPVVKLRRFVVFTFLSRSPIDFPIRNKCKLVF